MRVDRVSFQFVDSAPTHLADGVLYISIRYTTALHTCCCGCGREVVTPLSPAQWSLLFDGETVSLTPSIGNWNYPCRSHYWIRRNEVVWAGLWSDAEITGGQAADRRKVEQHLATGPEGGPKPGLLRRLWRALRHR